MAKESNQKLITSMSHDLRTPLTSLIGYVELLVSEKYKNKSQLTQFLQHVKSKAYQIKQLSDKLFEYFLVSQREEEAYQKIEISTFNLVFGLSEDQLFNLESQGFQVQKEFDMDSLKDMCMIDIEYVQRTLDNILSNIRKYARRDIPVRVFSEERSGFFILEFKNGIDFNSNKMESTGIGIKTCERIMKGQGGEFICRIEENSFISLMKIPLCSSKDRGKVS